MLEYAKTLDLSLSSVVLLALFLSLATNIELNPAHNTIPLLQYRKNSISNTLEIPPICSFTMADVRAMLRAERASRAAPSKPRKQAVAAPAPSSKKRKAEDEDEQPDVRKRTKAEEAKDLPAGFFDGKEEAEVVEDEDETQEASLPGFVAAKGKDPNVSEQAKATEATKSPGTAVAQNVVNEDEWAAFEEFAATVPSQQPSALAALNANATLSAAPVTADELAAQSRDEQTTRRGRREEEIEEEREEAARNLEEEFEVMEDLEGRVKRLREKREKLRRGSKMDADLDRPSIAPVVDETLKEQSEEEEDDDDEEADEFDGWRFGGS